MLLLWFLLSFDELIILATLLAIAVALFPPAPLITIFTLFEELLEFIVFEYALFAILDVDNDEDDGIPKDGVARLPELI